MVLFLIFFPGFGCIKHNFTVNWCQRNVSERNVSVLFKGCIQSKVASSLHFRSSIWTGLDGCQHTQLAMVNLYEKDHVFLDQWSERKMWRGSHYRQLHPGLKSRYSLGFSPSRNSSGAIGWYFIIYGISCGEYFESVHTRKLYVCMYF